MIFNEIIFLPGLEKQLNILLENTDVKNKSILIAGSNTAKIAGKLIAKDASKVIIIVDNQEDLLSMRLNLSDAENLAVRYMEYSNTDFINKKFDIIYAQASISRNDRNKILKEFKKIIAEDGILCIGEIVSLTHNPPVFVKDVWERSGISPLFTDKTDSFYKEKGFEIIDIFDLSFTLKRFYSLCAEMLKEGVIGLTKEEIKSYKSFLEKMKHETDVYLKLGGHKHIGFKTLLLKKESE